MAVILKIGNREVDCAATKLPVFNLKNLLIPIEKIFVGAEKAGI